jgi:hypothetical protein
VGGQGTEVGILSYFLKNVFSQYVNFIISKVGGLDVPKDCV